MEKYDWFGSKDFCLKIPHKENDYNEYDELITIALAMMSQLNDAYGKRIIMSILSFGLSTIVSLDPERMGVINIELVNLFEQKSKELEEKLINQGDQINGNQW